MILNRPSIFRRWTDAHLFDVADTLNLSLAAHPTETCDLMLRNVEDEIIRRGLVKGWAAS